MGLRETYKKQGAFLFRWRSYLPFLAIPVVILALFDTQYTKRLFGDRFDSFWEAFCILISLAGLIVRCLVAGYVPKGTSGRNVERQVAESLNTKGMYSIVRNPLYLGNYLLVLGVLLFTQVWWFVIIGSIVFWRYYERIIYTEEEFLREKFGEAFVAWSQKTPMALPRFHGWEKPDLPFEWKTVLRREHSSFFGIVTVFTILGVLADLVIERQKSVDLFWWIFFGTGLLIYLTLRFLKKKTKLLDLKGR